MKTLFMFMFLSLAGTAVADTNETPSGATAQAGTIPTTEREFVDTIHNFGKAKIIEQFGEPSKRDDILLTKDGKVSASIWQYHYLNTDASGTHYQTTELDFVDDNVVMVVFMNHDGEETPDDAVQVPLEPVEPDL